MRSRDLLLASNTHAAIEHDLSEAVLQDQGRVRSVQMTATGIRMTAADLLRLPDNGMRHELIDGELYAMPPAGGEHGYVGAKALGRLMFFLDQHREVGGGLFAAETSFRLSSNPDTVRAP